VSLKEGKLPPQNKRGKLGQKREEVLRERKGCPDTGRRRVLIGWKKEVPKKPRDHESQRHVFSSERILPGLERKKKGSLESSITTTGLGVQDLKKNSDNCN